MNIGTAPLQITPIEGNSFSAGWLQWIAGLGDSLEGEWSAEEWTLSASGVTVPSAYFSMSGSVIHCIIQWSTEQIASGATVDLPLVNGKAMTVLPSMLRVWDTATLKSGILVEGSSVIIPDDTYSNLIIEGTLFPQRLQAGR